MSASTYADHEAGVVVGTVSEPLPAPANQPGGLGDWEETNPCKYVGNSCRGKLFGALKRCRRRRERSEALCQGHEKALARQAEWEAERERLTRALQTSVVDTARQQKTAGSTMAIGLTAGGVALAGAVAVLALKRKKK